MKEEANVIVTNVAMVKLIVDDRCAFFLLTFVTIYLGISL